MFAPSVPHPVEYIVLYISNPKRNLSSCSELYSSTVFFITKVDNQKHITQNYIIISPISPRMIGKKPVM